MQVLSAGALGMALGLFAGTLVPSSQPPPAPAPLAATGDEPGALSEALQRERRERESLEQELAALREALTAAEARVPLAGDEPEAPAPPVAAAAKPSGKAGTRFDATRLEELGLAQAEIRRLRERHEELELERVYLRNQARREGWLHRPRFQREQRALRDELIAELGERDYDAMLYAAGERNRVIVARLLADSPAEAAGLQQGDALLRYDGRAIFEPGTIVEATADGVPGTTTELRVERGGEEIRLFVPRGPLGVQLSTGSRPPPGLSR